MRKITVKVTWASDNATIKPNKISIYGAINNSLVLEDVFKEKKNVFINETILDWNPEKVFQQIKNLEIEN